MGYSCTVSNVSINDLANNSKNTQTEENEFVDSSKKRKNMSSLSNCNKQPPPANDHPPVQNQNDSDVEDMDDDATDSGDDDYKPDTEYSSSSSSDDEISKPISRSKRSARHRKKRDSFIVYTSEEEEEEEEDDDEDEDYIECTGEDLKNFISEIHKLKKSTKNFLNLEETLSEEEENYYKKLSKEDQELLKTTYNTVVKNENSLVPIKFQIIQSNISDYLKNIALQKFNVLSEMEDTSHEYAKLSNWINLLCKIPFGLYQKMPISFHDSVSNIKQFLINTKEVLQDEVYGHNDAKDQILRIVAQWISNPSSSGNVIGIHGNPGVGKTTLIKNGVCKALNLPFASIPLGGANDSSFLEGHSYTYEGSSNGKIVDILIQSKVMNPVLYFDELDKVSESKKGQDIINLLIHLTDPSQNNSFQDKYFNNIDLDLSKCLIIFTYNNDNAINPILKDRMITINTKDYNISDKIEIAKFYLIPAIKKNFNIRDIHITNEDITYVIQKTKKEAGVRNLKRSIERIVSNVNLNRMLNEVSSELPLEINKEIIDLYVKCDPDLNTSIAHIYT